MTTEDWRTRARRELEAAKQSLADFESKFVPPATREQVLEQIRTSGAFITHFNPNAPYDELVTVLAQIRWMQANDNDDIIA